MLQVAGVFPLALLTAQNESNHDIMLQIAAALLATLLIADMLLCNSDTRVADLLTLYRFLVHSLVKHAFCQGSYSQNSRKLN